jgi:hypothetical protein
VSPIFGRYEQDVTPPDALDRLEFKLVAMLEDDSLTWYGTGIDNLFYEGPPRLLLNYCYDDAIVITTGSTGSPDFNQVSVFKQTYTNTFKAITEAMHARYAKMQRGWKCEDARRMLEVLEAPPESSTKYKFPVDYKALMGDDQ